MSLLKDLVNIKKPLSEKVDQNTIEMSLAYKHMKQAIDKGYPRQGAINFVTPLIKSQGFSAAYSKQCAEQAWKELNDETVTEGFNDPDAIADELMDAWERMTEIMDEVRHLVRACPPDIRKHAESYWVAHIVTALGGEHDYLGGTSKYDTMEATIQKLRELDPDEV